MRLTPILIALATLVPSLATAKRPVVAVFAVELRGIAGGVRAGALSSYLATRLAETGRFELVPQARIQQALAARRRESQKPCYAQGCQIQIGQEVAANLALVTQLHRLGGICVLTSSLYDLRRSTSLSAATAHGACSEPALLGLVDVLVAKLAPGWNPGPGTRVRRGRIAVPTGSAELLIVGSPEGARAVISRRGLRRECRLSCRIPGLPAAVYELEVSAPGHHAQRRTVTLNAGRALALSVDLSPSATTGTAPASVPATSPPEEASPLRGLTVVALTRASRLRHGIPEQVNFGVVVAAVASRSRAAQVGLRAGDVLLEAGGRKLESPGQLRGRLASGHRVDLLVHRQGKSFYLKL